MLKEALKKRDFLEDVNILARAGSIVRKDIFGHEGCKFPGKVSRNVTTIESQNPNFFNIQWTQLEKSRQARVPSMPHCWPGHCLQH